MRSRRFWQGTAIIAADLPAVVAVVWLCLDRGYDAASMHRLAEQHGYTPHIRTRGEELERKARIPGWRARRRVVEAAHSWLNRNRGWSGGEQRRRVISRSRPPARVSLLTRPAIGELDRSGRHQTDDLNRAAFRPGSARHQTLNDVGLALARVEECLSCFGRQRRVRRPATRPHRKRRIEGGGHPRVAVSRVRACAREEEAFGTARRPRPPPARRDRGRGPDPRGRVGLLRRRQRCLRSPAAASLRQPLELYRTPVRPHRSVRAQAGRGRRRADQCRPAHPQTLGKLERFHRTLKEWLADEGPPADLEHLQLLLDRFRAYHNGERPHQGIGDVTPAQRYLPGPTAVTPLGQLALAEPDKHPLYPPYSVTR
jgi:hypothetical protein